MLPIVTLFAEVDPISGGAGWLGAGLLGLVLGWLFLWHIPKLGKDQTEAVKAVVDHCDKELQTIRSECKEYIDRLSRAIESLKRD